MASDHWSDARRSPNSQWETCPLVVPSSSANSAAVQPRRSISIRNWRAPSEKCFPTAFLAMTQREYCQPAVLSTGKGDGRVDLLSDGRMVRKDWEKSEFSDRLTHAIRLRGMTGRSLEGDVSEGKLSFGSISRFQKKKIDGGRLPDFETLQKLVVLLDVDPRWLLMGWEPVPATGIAHETVLDAVIRKAGEKYPSHAIERARALELREETEHYDAKRWQIVLETEAILPHEDEAKSRLRRRGGK